MTFLKRSLHSPAAEKQLPLSGKSILLADDSLDNQLIIDHFLTENGATVSLASDGSEAVIKAVKGKFDLILMDIQMPKMNGHYAAEVLRGIGCKAPIIALTAFASISDKSNSKSCVFSSYLCKPFRFGDLLNIILAHDKNSVKKSVKRKICKSPLNKNKTNS